MEQNQNPNQPSSIDRDTAQFVKMCSSFALMGGIIFFVYSAYAGVILDGGSTQVFTGLGCLLLLLVGNFIIEKIVLKKSTKEVE